MKIETLYLPNIKYSQLPKEDFAAVKGSRFCVADGITRDPLGQANWTGLEDLDNLKHYPKPSPAAQAAKICVETFVASKSSPAQALIEANQTIAKINRGLKTDYLANDLAGTVAVGVKIEGETLFWASIGDCQLAHYDDDGRIQFISPDGLNDFNDYISGVAGDWRQPGRRALIRQKFRNNPAQVINGRLVSYGALTGEKKAEPFIKSGSFEFTEGTVILFSDGFAPIIRRPDFIRRLRQGVDSFKAWAEELAHADAELGHERTLISIEYTE